MPTRLFPAWALSAILPERSNSNMDNLSGGTRARLALYKSKAEKTLTRIRACRTPDEAEEFIKNYLPGWKHERYITPHGLGFNAPSATCGRSDDGQHIYMDSGAMDHLRECKAPRRNELSWYCDEDDCKTVSGHVSRISHNRFIAWISWSDCDGIAVDSSVYTDESDAFSAAEHMARTTAETEREYSERYSAASSLNDECDELKIDLGGLCRRMRLVCRAIKELRAMPIVPATAEILLRAEHEKIRDEWADKLNALIDKREILRTDYEDVF